MPSPQVGGHQPQSQGQLWQLSLDWQLPSPQVGQVPQSSQQDLQVSPASQM